MPIKLEEKIIKKESLKVLKSRICQHFKILPISFDLYANGVPIIDCSISNIDLFKELYKDTIREYEENELQEKKNAYSVSIRSKRPQKRPKRVTSIKLVLTDNGKKCFVADLIMKNLDCLFLRLPDTSCIWEKLPITKETWNSDLNLAKWKNLALRVAPPE